MTQQIKDEALEQLELEIKFGFENEAQLFERIREIFYSENDFDEQWLQEVISEKYNQHQKTSLTWTRPTDFDKLAKAFDELIQLNIVCLHNAGYTKQDGIDDSMEVIERLAELGINATGFCYYHAQDLVRAIDPEIRNLFLGFDSSKQDDTEALQVANKIVDTLKKHGFEVNWPGTADQRIEIKNIHWKKVPDNGEWGAERVLQILTKPPDFKKNFW